jgi:hypothetical protein
MNRETEDRFIKAALSLISDIKAMQTEGDTEWFGDFSGYEENPNGVIIEWPNLAISYKELEEAIEGVRADRDSEMDAELARIELAMVNAGRSENVSNDQDK